MWNWVLISTVWVNDILNKDLHFLCVVAWENSRYFATALIVGSGDFRRLPGPVFDPPRWWFLCEMKSLKKIPYW